MNRSLQFKLILSICSVFIVVSFVILSFIFNYSRNIVLDNQKSSYLMVTKEITKQIDLKMKMAEYLTQIVAKQSDIAIYLEDVNAVPQNDNIVKILQQYNVGGQYSAIYLIKFDGNVIASTDTSLVGTHSAFLDYFKNASEENFYIDVVLGANNKKMSYYFASPVKNESGLLIGAVAIKIELENIYKNIFSDHYLNYNDLMVVDQYGVIIYANRDERIFKSLGKLNDNLKKEIFEKKKYEGIEILSLNFDQLQTEIQNEFFKEGIIKVRDENDKRAKLFGISKINEHQVFLIIEDEYNKYITPILNIIYSVGGVVFVVVVVSMVLLSTLILKFLKPLREIKMASERVASGDYDFQLKEVAHDWEMRKLVASYNNMLLKIQSSKFMAEQDIKNKTKEILKNQKELEEKNMAILNVLEDMEAEKDKVNNFVNELEKFKLAVDSASDHIVITDKTGIVLYANLAAETITGFSLQEMIGKKVGSLWGGLMSKEYYQNLWRIILKEKKSFKGEIKNKQKNGQIYYAQLNISPILDSNKEVVFFVGIERDISQEKYIDIAKTEFVSLASHQLRTPLSAIGWYAEMILSGGAGKLNKDQLSYLKEIYNANKRMVELVNALLNVSRIELGTFTIEPQEINLVKLIEQSLSEFKVFVKKKKLSVHKIIKENLPMIKVDPKLTKMIFDNLFSNAIKYTAAKGTILWEVTNDSKNMIVHIKDSGIGIPKAQQKNIFTKLFRADNVRAIDTEGTGLGLYLVKSILDASGGGISIESEKNKGTLVKVLIPLFGMKQKVGMKNLN